MNGTKKDSIEHELAEKLRNSLVHSIVQESQVNEAKKYSLDKGLGKNELSAFFDRRGNIEKWLIARCLESVVASIGLDEYIRTLVSFRDASPSYLAPMNILLTSSQVARALDPIVVVLLKELSKKSKPVISREKLIALIRILTPDPKFAIQKSEEVFDVDEMERLRTYILQTALEKLQVANFSKYSANISKLKPIGQAPEFSLSILIEITKDYKNLDIFLREGFLIWRYGSEPTLFVKNGTCFYDPMELLSLSVDRNSVQKQFYLMKKAIQTKRGNWK